MAGKFLEKLLADLDLSVAQFARFAGVDARTVRNWLKASQLPRGAEDKVGRAIVASADLVRAAADGLGELPKEYRDREGLLRRRAGMPELPSGKQRIVIFLDAPVYIAAAARAGGGPEDVAAWAERLIENALKPREDSR